MKAWKPVVLAVLTLAVATAPAHAGWKTDRARAIASIVWGDPCGGDVTIAYRANATTAGAAYTAEWAPCIVFFQPGRGLAWGQFCTAMIHEYGHLAGYRDPTNAEDPYHSDNPLSVMYWTATGVDERCDGNGRPYLEKRGAL